MDELIRFRDAFKALTGVLPFPWQEELYTKHFSQGTDSLPSSCTLPTGLGKTAVVAIWLLALARHPGKLPRRLVYVVNRRTVVDQTTNEVEKLRERLREKEVREKLGSDWSLDGDAPLAISTLRGQFADNREWSSDPSRPAVIVATVDMIGSRLLFSGYGVGFKAKPLHAGFLGQDALIVHDEAHLEPAFQSLLDAIKKEQERCKEFSRFHVIQLTATSRDGNNAFGLTPRERDVPDEMPDLVEPIHHVWRRLKANKLLTLSPIEDEKAIGGVIAKIAEGYKDQRTTVLVFVRTLEAVTTVQKELEKTKRPVVLLTGTMRGKERDDLVKRPDFKRFLKGAASGETVYLVCTSAGEVGIDISADHMVCDLSTFESMIQRFGRVNRYGLCPETCITVVYPAKFDNEDKLAPAREATLKLLQQLNGDGSPNALNDLMASLTEKQREAAFAPPPSIPTATDILFDAWALTSIRQPMPGRPEVAPYLHGIAEDLPQTTVAWRAELDLLKDDPDPKAALKAIFSKHRIRPHESLTVNSFHLVKLNWHT